MITESKRCVILHDLMLIHRERLLAYEQLVKWINNAAVNVFFHSLADECRCCLMQLHSYMGTDLGDPSTRLQITGVVYQQWPGIKPVLPGCSEQELISACRENEKALYTIYKNVIQMQGIFNLEGKELLARHVLQLHKDLALLQNFKLHPPAVSIPQNNRISTEWRQRLVAE